MNWHALAQYTGLVGFNCAEIYAIDYLSNHAWWSPIVSGAMIQVVWGAYIEAALGGILFRPDALNNARFCPQGLLPMIEWPLTHTVPWKPEFWDLNYYVVMAGTAAAYCTTATLFG